MSDFDDWIKGAIKGSKGEKSSTDDNNKSKEENIELTKEQIKAFKELITTQAKKIKQDKVLIELAHELLVKEQNRIDAQKLKQKEDNKRLNIESQLSLQAERDIELAKRIDAEEKKRIATQNKLIKERDKNRVKLKLLQDRVHSYGLELKKVAGGSDLLRRALKGDAVAYQKLNRAIEKARVEQGKFSKAGVLAVRNTRNLGGSLSVLRSKLLIASFAFGGMVRMMKVFTDASKEQEIAVKRVSNVIKSQGYISGVTTKEVESLASALQNTTGVTDELTLESSALLLSFQNIGSDILPMAQKAVLDMTSALNGGKITTETLKTQTIQLAKALDDPIKGLNSLRRAGTTFDKATQNQVKTLVKQGKTLEAQRIILNAVNKQYGDSASIDSYEKSQRALDSAVGDLNERIGDFLTPTLKKTNELLTKFINSINLKDIAELGTSITTVSVAFVLLNKRMRQAIFTSTILTGGLTFLARATVGLVAVLGTKKLLDYADTFGHLDENTKKATKSTDEAREALGKFNKEQLQGQIDQYNQLISSTKTLQKNREQEILDIAKKTKFANKEGELNQEGLDWVKEKIKNDKELSRLTEYLVELIKDRTDAQAVLDAKESSSFDARKSNLEEILKKLREERVVLMQKDELTQKLTKSQIENGFITIDTSDASQNAIEEEIRLLDELAKKKKREKEIQKLSFQLASESASLIHQLYVNQLADVNKLEEAELNRIKNTSEYKLAVAQNDQTKINALEKKAKEASYKTRLDKFNADQNLAYSNIGIKLAEGIMNAVGTYGFPAYIPIVGLLTAIAGVQAGAVASQPKPQKYQYGGLVGGNLHSGGGTIIEAERGEYVMSRNAVKNFGLSNMESINNGSASPVNITFNNSVMSEDYTEDVIIPQIKRAVQRGADIGIS